MGCFLPCFNAKKHRKRKHLGNITPSNHRHHHHQQRDEAGESLQLSKLTEQEVSEEPIKSAVEPSREKSAENQFGCNAKKVAFDLSVKRSEDEKEVFNFEVEETENIATSAGALPLKPRYQNFESEEYEDLGLGDNDLGVNNKNVGGDEPMLVQEELSESLFSLSIDSRKQVYGAAELGEKEVTSPMPKSGSPINIVKGRSENIKESLKDRKLISENILSNAASLPVNHRYQNCEDEEYEDLDFGEDGGDDQLLGQEVSSESLFSLSIDSRKQPCGAAELGEKEVSSSMPKSGSPNNMVEGRSENKGESIDDRKLISENIASNAATLPVNHRYQNCEDEEYGDLDMVEDDDDNAGGDDQVLVQEESSESLFSLSIDSRKQPFGVIEYGEKEVTSPMPKSGSPNQELEKFGSDQNIRGRSLRVDSVLSPIENLTQWKVVKARATLPSQHQDKENIYVEQNVDVDISPEPSFKILPKVSTENAKEKKFGEEDVAVDTSLSSWLPEATTTPMSKGSVNSVANSPSGRTSSPTSHEDRPILGALIVEELKKLSASNSPRRSRNISPDETPIVRTVGSYWIHTGRIKDSDSGSSSRGRYS